MALEAWGHHRIDAGESIETVIADIFGDDEVPAAYLLVIIDLLLSHWPKSRKAAIPFVGSPELLSWDRTRQIYDSRAFDFGMLGEKEPRGLANRESLKKRASRGALLELVLPYYLFREPLADGDAVRARLEKAAVRLGPYESHSSMADPRLMVVYALNQLDQQNYEPRVVRDEAGNEQTYYEYVSPAAEANHLAPMQAQAAAQMAGTNLRNEVAIALKKLEKTSADLIARSIVWAREIDASGEPQPDFDHSVLITAALVMRDGNAAQRQEHGAWANGQFQAAIARAEDPVHRHRDGLQFNPIGIAAIGMAAAVRHGGGLSDARLLLPLAVKGDPAAAHGFGADVNSLTAIDPRLPKSLLRGAFTGSIRARLKRYDGNADEDAARQRQVAEWREKATDAEWRWLQGEGDEPAWPEFPEARIRVREPIYIGDAPLKPRKKPQPEAQFYADHQAAVEIHRKGADRSFDSSIVTWLSYVDSLSQVNTEKNKPNIGITYNNTNLSLGDAKSISAFYEQKTMLPACTI